MPSLKDLTCTIELSQTQQPLPEYNTLYSDGLVETCVPIPRHHRHSFTIHLTSTKFIAPGIAIFVYIDGVYQCNRNRQGLEPGVPSDRRSVVDFRLRQKEETRSDGSMVAREWAFDAGDVSKEGSCTPSSLENNKDCIEVVVLRCAGTRDTVPQMMNLDGAGDWSDCYLDSDGASRKSNRWHGYDDRGPEFCQRLGSAPMSYRAPYAETLRSCEDEDYKSRDERDRESTARHSKLGSRYSGTTSTRTRRADDLPPGGFQYGCGPVPSDRGGSPHRKHSDVGLETNGVDPVWLNKLLKTAVKQGVEESRRVEAQSERHDESSTHGSERQDLTSQAPGAWPGSPILEFKAESRKSKRVSSTRRSDGYESDWDKSQDAWSQHETKSKAKTHVDWDIDPVWEMETSSGDNGWHSNDETPSESWDTDETWETTKAEKWKGPSESVRLCPSTSPPSFEANPRGQPVPFKAGYATQSEGKRWANDTPSPSSSSSNDTIHPSHFHSHAQTPRRQSKSSTRPSNSPHTRHHSITWQTEKPSAPSSITHLTPVIVNAPATQYPQSNKASSCDETWGSAQQVPAWVVAVHDTMGRQASGSGNGIPAPFGKPWDGGGKDTTSAWDEDEKNSPTVSEKRSRFASSSTWDPDSTWDSTPKLSSKTAWTAEPKPSHKTNWTTQPPPPPPPFASCSPLKKSTKKSKKTTQTPSSAEKPLPTDPKQPKNAYPPSQPQQTPAPAPPFTAPWSFPPSPQSPSLHPASQTSKAAPMKSPSTTATTAIRTKEASGYGHAVARPEYLDSLQSPYAVFRFRCRREEGGVGE